MSIAASGMGYRPPRMKIRRGCLPRVLWPAAGVDSHSCSQLDDWFLEAGRSSQPRSAPVPFFPEVHEELTKSWTTPFTARSHSSPSSILTTLNSWAARGYVDVPHVERAVAVHLCPQNATTWRNRLCLPSKAYKMTAYKTSLQSLQCCGPGRLCPACNGYPAGPPSQGTDTNTQGHLHLALLQPRFKLLNLARGE